MKHLVKFIIFIIFFACQQVMATSTFEGGVSAEGAGNSCRIIDKATGNGVGSAKISIPKQNYYTQTDSDGYFELDTQIDGTTIMSIKKDNYKPYSVTVTDQTFSSPVVIGIEKSNSQGIVLDSDMYHLGDNNYSDLSANASEFSMKASGPFYNKKFIMKNLKFNQPIYLVIGSIIGIDTEIARSIGQNQIANAFASPPEVYFNGNKIVELQINGDGQRVRIPTQLIRKNQVNEVTIRTGRNLMQTAYIDYDDIEFMNLFFEN
ncbi:MAG: carboxypeptidase-like regulatory domain-containing protein [bacterium]|nr:carboxypeptidase-like regulatory domain-containing protein [bacterium]